jgi:hypothetical protein
MQCSPGLIESEISQKVLKGQLTAELPALEKLRKDRKVWER